MIRKIPTGKKIIELTKKSLEKDTLTYPIIPIEDLQTKYMKCPFCLTQIVEPNPGMTYCSNCHAKFEIDDRAECFFADIENLRLPVNGIVCQACGLIQGEGRDSCGYCGGELFAITQ